MSSLRRYMPLGFSVALLFVMLGCGNPAVAPQEQDRQAVDSSLRALYESSTYRFRLEVETWVGVSGYTVYGSERGEGFLEEGEFSLSVLRSSPAGEEILTIFSQDGLLYSKEDGEIWPVAEEDLPNRLYDPRNLPEVLSAYGMPVREGEEENSEAILRVYRLDLGSDRARDILSGAAWEYFCNLRFELKCRVWVGDASSPPAKLSLELAGYDPQEGLRRYRSLITLTPNPAT